MRERGRSNASKVGIILYLHASSLVTIISGAHAALPIEGPSQKLSLSLTAALVIMPVLMTAASFYAARDLILPIFFLLGLVAFAGVGRMGNDRCYILLIFSLTLSLLFATTFVSRNLSGYDIHQEYYIFLQTVSQGWHPENQIVYNSVLSISILPTVIYTVTGLDALWLFKIVFPILYSVVPVVLYMVYRKFLSAQAAFLSAFLFISFPTSYVEMTALGRQEIAELILAVLLLVLCTPRLRESPAGKITIGMLTVGFVTSHYSLAFIYLFLLSFSLLLAKVSRRITALCTPSMFGFSVLIILSWYLLVSGGRALGTLTGFIAIVANGLLGDIFNPLSRPSVVVQALGLSGALGLLHLVNRVTQYLVQFLLLIGFASFLIVIPKNASAKTILSPMIVALLLLLSSVALPFFAFGLNLSRVYHIALFFIAPCFVYGVDRLASWLRTISRSTRIPRARLRIPRRRIFAATILTTYFLFVGGWVWAVSNDSPTSFVLDSKRMVDSRNIDLKVAYFGEYTVAEDIQAVQWLKFHASSKRTVCGDFISTDHVLNSYGGFARYLPQIPDECSYQRDYVYLSEFNVVNGTGTQALSSTDQIVTWHISGISPELTSMNVIYSGDSCIYLSP